MELEVKFGFRSFYGLIVVMLVGTLFSSCKTQSSTSGMVQKRKYQKGYHVNVKNPFLQNSKSIAIAKTSVVLEESNRILEEQVPIESTQIAGKHKTGVPVLTEDPEVYREDMYSDYLEASLDNEAIVLEMPAYKVGNKEITIDAYTHQVKQTPVSQEKTPKILNGFAFLSAIFGLVAWFLFAGIPLGSLAIILDSSGSFKLKIIQKSFGVGDLLLLVWFQD